MVGFALGLGPRQEQETGGRKSEAEWRVQGRLTRPEGRAHGDCVVTVREVTRQAEPRQVLGRLRCQLCDRGRCLTFPSLNFLII